MRRYSSESASIRLPPPWGTVAGRLGQQQALLGRGREEPAAAAFLDQRLVVELRLEAEQGEPEAVLAARLAVAAAGVAAELGEDRDDLVGEVDGPPVGELADGDRHPGFPPSRSDRDRRRPVPSRHDQAGGVDRGHPGVRAGVLGQPGQVLAASSPRCKTGGAMSPWSFLEIWPRTILREPRYMKSFLLKCQDENLLILSSQDSALVNALQRRAAVVLQKSLREGFGLTVAEAMLKGTPVIGGKVGALCTRSMTPSMAILSLRPRKRQPVSSSF